jgi:uncharacterized protein (DUF433 family)
VADAGSVLAAFSEEHVERLTGLTRKQLRYWDRTGFFTPAFADENRRLPYSRVYSFRDVVALRTISALRSQFNVPLQELRRVRQKLNDMSNDLWVKTELYAYNKKVIFHNKETGALQEVVSGQYVVPIDLQKVVGDTEKAVQRLRERPAEKIGCIERSRTVNHNAAVVAGTRIPTNAIRRFAQAGYTVEQIIREYPDLTPADVNAALAYEEKQSVAA